MKKIQAIFSDFDGTIVNTKSQIDTADIELIHQLKKSGIMFVGATGRHFPVARSFALQIGTENPFILCNGGIIYNYATESIEEIYPLDSSIVPPMIEFAEKEGIMFYLYIEQGVYMSGEAMHRDVKKVISAAEKDFNAGEVKWDSKENFSLEGKRVIKLLMPGCTAEGRERLLSSPDIDSSRFTAVFSGGEFLDNFSLEGKRVIKLLMPGCTAEGRERLLSSPDIDSSRFTAVFSGGEFLDINGAGVNKGNAMLGYCRRYNIDPSATIALGDNFNDVEMLQNAGIAI